MISFDRTLCRAIFAVFLVMQLVIGMASPAAARNAPEQFELGARKGGDSCSASRQWTGGKGDVLLASEQPFGISCRSVSAAEEEGYVSAPGATVDTTQCGNPVSQLLPDVGPVEARRCFDRRMSRLAVDIRFTRKGVIYHGAAQELTLGPLEVALRVIAAGAKPPAAGKAIEPAIDLAKVPPGPTVSAAGESAAITAEAALTNGIAALQSGRMLDASRTLNDALRVFATADPGTQIDLRLAAGLADSNLSQFEAADAHFEVAQSLLQGNPALPEAARRQQQLVIYRGLHLINQHQWDQAIADLTHSGTGSLDLSDPVTLTISIRKPRRRATGCNPRSSTPICCRAACSRRSATGR